MADRSKSVESQAGEIVDDLVARMIKVDKTAEHWYAGISGELDDRLKKHNLYRGDTVFVEQAPSVKVARVAENQLHTLGCDGDQGGDVKHPAFVYVYLINDHTIEDTSA